MPGGRPRVDGLPGVTNPRNHLAHPLRARPGEATDSATVPWGGRELSPSGFEADDGAADPALRAALGGTDTELMAAVAAARFLIPIVAEPTGADDSGEHPVETGVDMAAVTLVAPDGERALPVFTGLDSLTAWDPAARPVPMTAARVGQAAVAERCDVVVVDVSGPHTRVLRPSMVWSLAQERAWLPAHEDPFVARAVERAVAQESDVGEHDVGEGAPAGTGVLGVVLGLRPGLTHEEVQALATRVGDRLATDGELRARVDGLSFTIR